MAVVNPKGNLYIQYNLIWPPVKSNLELYFIILFEILWYYFDDL